MSYTELLNRLGFESDPFAKTNADEEERLNKYFIHPPFFNAVLGAPETPKSAVVLAPRGGGKTALKRKIEIESETQRFLCVTYNTFDISEVKLSEIDAGYHLTRIARLVLIGVITAASIRGVEGITGNDRHLLYLLCKAHLSKISLTDMRAAISAVKTWGDKGMDIWNKFAGPLAIVVNALLQKVGLGEAEIKKFEAEGGDVGSLIEQLRTLARLSQHLGFHSIYVLIDKVDETAFTGGAKNAFKFIEPIIGDLQLLELPDYAFKIFLWDKLLEDYQAIARPDRVKYYRLLWPAEQLNKMLSERLRAYSGGAVFSLAQVCEPGGQPLDELVSLFAQGSPRMAIRICKEIVDQQSEIDDGAKMISEDAIVRGFAQIAKNVSEETFHENIVRELQKTHRCDFTIRHLYTNVFKFSQQAGLQKVTSWEDAGAVVMAGKIQETAGAKGSNHYALSHWMLAKHVFTELSIRDFVNRKLIRCDCGEWLLRDWDISPTQSCHWCQSEITGPRLTEVGSTGMN